MLTKLKMIATAVLISFSAMSFVAAAQDFDKGMTAAIIGDFATALKEWKPLAEQGDASAQYSLALMYYSGEGVVQNYKEAVKWYRLAAEQGLARAQYNLGNAYYKGEGVVQDYKEAVKWYRLAAEQGQAGAQNNLALMYEDGEGVVQDFALAHMWYNISAAIGEDKASKNRDSVAAKMTSADLTKAQYMAKECVNSDYKNCGD